MSKAPIGLVPKFIWEELRYKEIMDAMTRYSDAGILVPLEWLEEAIELRRKIEARIKPKREVKDSD